MLNRNARGRQWRLAAALAAGLAFLSGCDPTLQATIEDGIITASSSFVGALIRALIELASEANAAATAQLFTDAAQRIVA